MTDTFCNTFPCDESDSSPCCASSCETILDNELLTKIAIYWPSGAIDEDGERGIGTPVEMQCHWEDTYQEFVDSQGKTFVSTATVYLKARVKVDGWLWLSSAKICDDAGTGLQDAIDEGLIIENVDPTPDTQNPPQNQMIRVVMMVPDIDNVETLWRVQL